MAVACSRLSASSTVASRFTSERFCRSTLSAPPTSVMVDPPTCTLEPVRVISEAALPRRRMPLRAPLAAALVGVAGPPSDAASREVDRPARPSLNTAATVASGRGLRACA